MDAKADFAIRQEITRLKSAVNDILKRYEWLDNANSILSAVSEQEILSAISALRRELSAQMIGPFFDSQLMKVSRRAIEENIRALQSYIRSGRISVDASRIDRIVESSINEVNGITSMAISSIETNLSAKVIQFRRLAETQLSRLSNIQERIENIAERTMRRDRITDMTIRAYWESLSERYGWSDTVRYRNGANYPLRSYVDGRARTSADEVHRITSETFAIQNGIYTGRISRHRTTDSCIYWEGKIVFFNRALKNEFLREFPNITEARNWPTVDDVKNDRTHMFSFNCRHTVLADPIQFQDDLRHIAAENKMPKIPKRLTADVVAEELKRVS